MSDIEPGFSSTDEDRCLAPIKRTKSTRNPKSNDELTLLEFTKAGSCQQRTLSRSELMDEIRRFNIPTKRRSSLPETPRSRARRMSVRPRTFVDRTLQLRDFRLVTPKPSRTSIISVRSGVVLFCMEDLKIITLMSKCFLICTEHTQEPLELFRKNFSSAPEEATSLPILGSQLPFEFRALEAAFLSVREILEKRIQSLEKETKSLLAAVRTEMTQKLLDRLRILKNDVNTTHSRVRNCYRAVEELVHNTESMQMMYLTKLHAIAEDRRPADPIGENDYEEIEMLLEHYLSEFDEVSGELVKIRSEIENTETLLNMNLDDSRNILLQLEAVFTMVSMSVGGGGMVTAIMGMNLKNNGEESYSDFFWTSVGISIAIVISTVSLLRVMRKRGVLL